MFGLEDLSPSAIASIVGFGASLIVLFLFQGVMSSRQTAREAARKQHALQLEILQVQKELAKNARIQVGRGNVHGLGAPARPLRKPEGRQPKKRNSIVLPTFVRTY